MELVSYTITGDPFAGENLPRFLANAHTGFNVACVLLFVWFVGAFAAVTRMVVPAKAHEPVVPSRILDRHLLNTPALALAQAWAELAVMLDKSRLAMTTALKATLESQSEEFATMSADVRALEAEVDDLQAAVTEYVSNLTRSPLNEDQGRMLPRLLHSVNDAERIGDYAMQLLRLGRRVRKRELVFSPAAQEEMGRIFNSTESLLTGIAEFLKDGERMDLALSRDPAVAEELDRLRILAKLVRKQAKDFRRAHEERFAQSICDVRSGVVFTNMLTSLERVSGHVTNIVQALSAREQVTVVDRT
jgi:phosphate:Na+ symporter